MKTDSKRVTIKSSTQGFTLVELLIVVLLISIVTSFAVSGVNKIFKASLRTASRDIATKVKETYNSTMMTKRVHRIVYDLKEQTYWVEVGPTSMLLETEESREKEQRIRRYNHQDEEDDPENTGSFSLSKTITRKPIPLGHSVFFDDISTEQSKEAITEGRAYTHFFPNGMIEQTVIHLKDNSNHQSTLVIQPLVGRMTIVDYYISREEALKE